MITQLQDNIRQIKRELDRNAHIKPYNHEVRRTLGAALIAHTRELELAQAEADAELIDTIQTQRMNYFC